MIFFFSRPTIFEKEPKALQSSKQLFIYQRRGSWIRWVWDEHGQSQYVNLSVFRSVLRLHNRFLQVCARGIMYIFAYVYVCTFGIYVPWWVRSAVYVICECVPVVCVRLCVCTCMFVCICLQSGRSQILHIYMIQLACSIKIIYNCYNI